IRLERFEKRYGKVQAVKPIDLEIRRGETFALLGPNGSGKTTIIRSIVGLHRPSGGRILVDGIDVVDRPDEVKARLSYAPQRVTMPDMLTAREVAALFGRLKSVADERVDHVLDLFGLADAADRKTREFSGGMLQRLGLAVAFLKDVPLLVLDEPTV
ncbi:MAG: ATP-binding cassette domain-containing protein, partial [Acidobacteria bacterium]|nr:ATP-binding cassette domain-containing protein [Acidobacteriota bacterium]NIQ86772.1 ATP-binding cassette domain-containing protein [Acidobacteriota bacterium]